jgi:hypothetical protein
MTIKTLHIQFLLSLIIFFNCSTIGIPNPIEKSKINFLDKVPYKLCILKDKDIPDQRVDSMMYHLKKDLMDYNIDLIVQSVIPWERKHFFTVDILFEDVVNQPFPKDCDRLVAFVSRNILDLTFSFFGEILGLVETKTRTRGLVYADYLTFNLIIGATPSSVLIHENYHFLGCNHHIIMNNCYATILNHKKQYLKNKDKSFFPSTNENGDFINTHPFVNQPKSADQSFNFSISIPR